MDEDEFDYLPESNQLDFEPILRAAVLVDLPYVPLCAEDCKGFVPAMRREPQRRPFCGCKPVEDDVVRTDSGKPSQFAALKNFQVRIERRTRQRPSSIRLCWIFGRAVLPCGGFPKATARYRSLRSLCARLASFSF